MWWNPLLLLLFFVFLCVEAKFNCQRKKGSNISDFFTWDNCADETYFLPALHEENFFEKMVNACTKTYRWREFEPIFEISPEYSTFKKIDYSNKETCLISEYKDKECAEKTEGYEATKTKAMDTICAAYKFMENETEGRRKWGESAGSARAYGNGRENAWSCVSYVNGTFTSVDKKAKGKDKEECSASLNIADISCIVAWKMHIIQKNVELSKCPTKTTIIKTKRPPMTTIAPSSPATTTTVPTTSRRTTLAPTTVPSMTPRTTVTTKAPSTAPPTTTKATTTRTSTTTKASTTKTSTTTSASTSTPKRTSASSTTTRTTPRSTATTSVLTSTSSDRWTTASAASSSSTTEDPTSTEKTSRVVSPLIPVAHSSTPSPRISSIPNSGNDNKEATAAPSESQQKEEDDKGYMLWVYIAGGVLGTIFIVVAVILIIVCIKKCVNKRKRSKKDTGAAKSTSGKSTSSTVKSSSKSIPPERKKAAPLKVAPPRSPVVAKKDPSLADLDPKNFEVVGIITVEGGIKGEIEISETSSHSLLDAWVDDQHKVYFMGSEIEKIEESPGKTITCTEGATVSAGRTAKTTKSQDTLKRGEKKDQPEKPEEKKKKIQIRTGRTLRR